MITIAVQPLTETLLVAIRLGTVLLFTPIEAIRLLPIHARILLVLMISLLIVGHLPSSVLPADDISLALSSLAEFSNGLMLSLGIYAAFGVFQIAGQLIDTQMGLNALAILNPADHSHEPLSGRLLTMLAVLFFFALDGHHQLLQALLLSFKRIAPGQCVLFEGFVPVIQQCALMFSLALMLACPMMLSIMIIDLSGAVLTRNMPQINTYFLTLPIKIMLGLLMLSLLLNDINPLMQQAFQQCFQTLMQVMA